MMAGGPYLKCLKKVRILFMIDVADGSSTWQKDLELDNVVYTQSILIGQEGITTTQQPSRDSNQRISANYAQLVARSNRCKVVVDLAPDDTRPNVESLLVLIVRNLVKICQRNEEPDGRTDLRNRDMTPTFDL